MAALGSSSSVLRVFFAPAGSSAAFAPDPSAGSAMAPSAASEAPAVDAGRTAADGLAGAGRGGSRAGTRRGSSPPRADRISSGATRRRHRRSHRRPDTETEPSWTTATPQPARSKPSDRLRQPPTRGLGASQLNVFTTGRRHCLADDRSRSLRPARTRAQRIVSLRLWFGPF